jgi:hypothetical protein
MADLTDLQQAYGSKGPSSVTYYGIKDTTNSAPPAAPTGSNMNPASISIAGPTQRANVSQPTSPQQSATPTAPATGPVAPTLGVGQSNSTSPLTVGSKEYFANEEAKRKADIAKKRGETPLSANISGPTQTYFNQVGSTPLDSIIKQRTNLLDSYGLGKLI